ncbi:alpha-mannosidase [Labedella endophytica]|uniref:Alpha-mannosidase n=1 Tax=Labedella endophytica TaxID=1523160 RepID=A0A3S0VIG1_9MICO|nr:glycoside hydrolase family 38 C-terminal domain-containing protein [Labedella endophytica]RUR03277.1 alpha-mannosidase [Labedella endophytica]
MPEPTSFVDLRIRRFLSERITPAIYREREPLTVTAWDVPGEPVPYAEAVTQEFRPFTVGEEWSRPWGTTWFHLTGTVPADWTTEGTAIEIVLDLGFVKGHPGFQAEGLVWDTDGNIVKAVEPFNNAVPLSVRPGDTIDLYVEAASNPDVQGESIYAPTELGDLATSGDEPLYRTRVMDIGLRDIAVWELAQDIWTLDGLWRELGEELPRRAEILRGLERAIDAVEPDDVAGTAPAGREALAPLLASPAYASAHRLIAVGHAHIDSAWLWPVRETIRKCARTFSNVLALMDENDEFFFACSSAQQFAWMKEFYPELFTRIKARVLEGRFVPVGGMWVESDTNLPGGEAMARQFVTGKGFFLREFGIDTPEVWLPDSFGYSAAMPQVVRASGSRYFLTQKPSWNETNVMPHHTFHWEGIDGTRVFTHFPPVDSYNATLSAEDLHRAQRQYKEKGEANTSLVPFGYGDGGGGPTREMVAAAERTRSLEGSPTVEMASPVDFFERAEAELPKPPVWSGELYLEFHRGTYTSQARTKRGNRRSEHLLREAELWATAATIRAGAEYPTAELEDAWHTVLLNQFHDILPGSSIAWVYQVAEEQYERVAGVLEGIIERSLAALAGAGDRALLANAGPYAVDGVSALGGSVAVVSSSGTSAVRVDRSGDTIALENGLVRVVIDADGLVSSLYDLRAERELVAPGERAGELWIYRDTPAQWDAWDIDVHYQRHGTAIRAFDSIEVVSEDDAAATVRITRSRGESTFVQEFTLTAGRPTLDLTTTIDWHERQKLLKLAFPLDVHAERASSEIQFGHIHRPTHVNTSWDAARFETSAHRWVHVGEPGYGVAVANDSTYGHDITRSTRDADRGGDGGTTTLVRESLLRAPTFPDPHADQGRHVLRTAIRVGADVLEAAAEGYRLNVPPRAVTGGADIAPLLTVDDPAVVVEAVKLAEDGSGDVIVRLYEARGSKARASLTAGFAFASVTETDLLERDVEPTALVSSSDGAGPVSLSLRPFHLVTLRFHGVTAS